MTKCPNCGQALPEPATPRYVVGLLAPPVAGLALATAAFQFGYLGLRTFYAFIGAGVMGAAMLVQSDPHIQQYRRDLTETRNE